MGTPGAENPAWSHSNFAGLTAYQRKSVVVMCELHEQRIDPMRYVLRSWKTYLRLITFVLLFGASIYVGGTSPVNAPFLLVAAFLLGAELRSWQQLRLTARLWPLYEAIIDWDRAHLLSKGASRDTDLLDHPLSDA